ncbi:MAG: hypothetical protein IJY09_05025 [Lachnospiraceae bacterium]|nr:hypothetical protein [Lachnospiraceae bacterium]
MDKQSLKELRAGKNVEKNLPPFMTELASDYCIFAGNSFAMQYYSFYEALADKELELAKEAEPIWQELNRLVKDNLLGGFDGVVREQSIVALTQLRDELRKVTRVVTTYTDKISLYEYILNRVELQFEDNLEDIDEDEAAREILRYIFQEKDNMLVNMKIKEMLAQLPIRMSRGKFCDLLKDSLELYLESEQSSVEDFVYLLESSAGLYECDGMEELFPELRELYQALSQMDATTMTKEQYEEMDAKLQKAAAFLQSATDGYMGLMELANSLYAWILNLPYASMEAEKKTAHVREILQAVQTNVESGSYENVPEALVDGFVQSEGILERYADGLQSKRGILEELEPEVAKTVQALMLEKQMECLKRTPDLTSSSLFAEEGAAVNTAKVDRSYIDTVIKTETEKVLTAIATQPKALNRAMMAAVLSQLPVFFNSQNDVMDYVRGSLAGCHDVAERVASYRLMKQIME